MTRITQTWVLTRREFMQRAKSRAFQVMTLVTIGLVLAIIPLLALTMRDADPAIIGLTPGVAPQLEEALRHRAAELDVEIAVRSFPNLASAEAALQDGDADVVVTPDELVWYEHESSRTRSIIVGANTSVALHEAAADLGLTEAELAALLASPSLGVRVMVEPDPEEEPRQIGALIGLLLLYMSIIIFGQFVALGVMEEKQNRVVEVVLSRVEPTQVLMSKVLGIGALGLLQLLLVGGAVWLAVNLVDLADVSLRAIGAEILAWVVFWYLLGYLLYAVIYAALGATVTRQEDLQGALLIPVLVILPGFFIAQLAMSNSELPLIVAASFIPLWSPMVMPVRAAVSDVALWEIVLTVALVIATAYGIIRLGARIYSGAILQFGAKVKLRDAWRSSAMNRP